jgi:colanic acid/amylovoran biosynthesis protein
MTPASRQTPLQPSPVFVLEGNNVHSNHGCEAIDRGTYAVIRAAFPSALIINCGAGGPCGGDEGWFRPEGMKFVSYPKKYSPHWILRKLRQCADGSLSRAPWLPFAFEDELHRASAVLTLGGDNWSLDYNRPIPQVDAAMRIARSGRPLVHWCSSIGPFDRDREFERLARKALGLYDLVLARESCTVDYLNELGLSTVKACVDPAFVMQAQPKHSVPRHLAAVIAEPFVTVAIASRIGSFPENRAAYRSMLVYVLREATRLTKLPIVLVPHVVGHGVYDDQAFSKELERDLADVRPHIISLDGSWNAPELKWLISKSEMHVGSRTHATIAALSECVPTGFLGYSLKARGLCRDITGGEEFLASVTSGTKMSILALFDKVWCDRTQYRARLCKMMPLYRQRAFDSGKELKALLGDYGSL